MSRLKPPNSGILLVPGSSGREISQTKSATTQERNRGLHSLPLATGHDICGYGAQQRDFSCEAENVHAEVVFKNHKQRLSSLIKEAAKDGDMIVSTVAGNGIWGLKANRPLDKRDIGRLAIDLRGDGR